MRYDAHSGIAVLHGVGILDKGNQMAEPISCIVEIDEQGNTSIKYAYGTPCAVNIAECSAEVLKQMAPCKMACTATDRIDSLYIGATKGGQKFLFPYFPTELTETVEDMEDIHYMLDGTSVKLFKNGSLNSVECNVTVKIGELEFGPFPLCMIISREVMTMPSKMKMWLYPKPARGIQYSKPYCVDFKPFLRELEAVDSKDECDTVRDMNYGSVEASVRETVYDSGWGECLVLVERCFPYIPAPVIYRCTRSRGVVNCEVVAS